MRDTLNLHASCVAIGSGAILLLGESGFGKSDLALRLIDRGAKLVSDDQVSLVKSDKQIIASSATNIAGLLEIRGAGIFKLEYKNDVVVRLVVNLVSRENIERLPYPQQYECMGITFPQINICPFDISSAIIVEMALASLSNHSMMVGALQEGKLTVEER